MADKFENYADKPDFAARSVVAVTPNDSTDLTDVAKALYVGGAGNISLIAADDSAAVTVTGVTAGSILPIRAKRVRATSTTATNILALY